MLSHKLNSTKIFAALVLLLTASSVAAMPVLAPSTSNGFNGGAAPVLSGSTLAKAPSAGPLQVSPTDYTMVYTGPNGQSMSGSGSGGGGAGDPTSVPEPTALMLIGAGLIGLALGRRRRN